MFHSFGTVQSNTCVPLGTSCTARGMCSRIRPRVCANAIAGEAPADREEPGHQRVDIPTDGTRVDRAVQIGSVHSSVLP